MDREVGYHMGQIAWSDVKLSANDHAVAWEMVPDDPPLHVEDFYLSAAGGFRIDRAWERIELDLGHKVRHTLSFKATADYFIEDLWADVIAAVMTDVDDQLQIATTATAGRPSKLLLYRARVNLAAYLVTIGKRLAISRHRKRKPRLGLADQSSAYEDSRPIAIHDPNSVNPADRAVQQEAGVALRKALRDTVESLSSEQRLLLALVYVQDAKQKEAAAVLGWAEHKVSRHLKSAIQKLGEAVLGLSDTSQDAAAFAKWAQDLRKILEVYAQEPHAIASGTYG